MPLDHYAAYTLSEKNDTETLFEFFGGKQRQRALENGHPLSKLGSGILSVTSWVWPTCRLQSGLMTYIYICILIYLFILVWGGVLLGLVLKHILKKQGSWDRDREGRTSKCQK